MSKQRYIDKGAAMPRGMEGKAVRRVPSGTAKPVWEGV